MTSPVRRARPARRKIRLEDFGLESQLREATDGLLGGLWPHAARHFGFPLLTQHIDGFKNSLYVLAGASRMGKTTFALQLAWQTIRDNADTQAIYASLDQPSRELNMRLVAMAGEAPVDYVLHPDPLLAEKYDRKRQAGINAIFEVKEQLTIVDESHGGLTLDDLTSLVEQKRRRFDGPLLIFLDPIYKLRVPGAADFTQRMDWLSQELKTLSMAQKVAIVGTTRLAHGAGKRRPSLEDLEEQAALLYEAQVILLFYCDYFNNADTTLLEWEWGTDDLMVPIFELQVAKNKMGGFANRLYYRFYNSFSKFRECPQVEIDNYDRMLKNLQRKSPEHEGGEELVVQRLEVIDET
ncbi:MAG: AAA family ATPase [Candidatus Wallbacteria bacterium]|nr:AAA family ATPase [Candidatus Wallbacteria bacterium]